MQYAVEMFLIACHDADHILNGRDPVQQAFGNSNLCSQFNAVACRTAEAARPAKLQPSIKRQLLKKPAQHYIMRVIMSVDQTWNDELSPRLYPTGGGIGRA
jgi:hypothetical protein